MDEGTEVVIAMVKRKERMHLGAGSRSSYILASVPIVSGGLVDPAYLG
jgi:hypothetical protein